MSRVQSAPFGVAAEITTMVAIAHCLSPPNSPEALEGSTQAHVTYALENWVPHAEEFSLSHHPELSLWRVPVSEV